MTLAADRISASMLSRLPGSAGSGTVHSAFRQTVNVLCDDMTWVSLHPTGHPMHPYAVCVRVEDGASGGFGPCGTVYGMPAAGSLPLGWGTLGKPAGGCFLKAAVGDSVLLSRSRIWLRNQNLMIDLTGAEVWNSGLRCLKEGCKFDHAATLDRLRRHLGMRCITSPFLAAVLKRPVTTGGTWSRAVRTEALDIFTLICAGLGTCRPEIVLEGISRAVGLGPGFTPSGDDFLTGFLGAYRYLAPRDEMRKQVFALMGPVVRRTTLPAFFMLEGALNGCLPESLTGLLRAMDNRSRTEFPKAFQRLTRTGATSGEDMLAGVMAYLVARAGTRNTHAAN